MDRDLPEKFGRYRILQRLGQGGMGSVYLAEDTSIGRRVALKVPLLDEDSELRTRFQREQRIVAGVTHPNLCVIHDVGEIDGLPYLTMPFFQGEALLKQIGPNHIWPPRAAVELVRKIASALNVLHQHGIVHRDLKPANILLVGGEPVVLDFGLARSFWVYSGQVTKGSERPGTLRYMSPEQCRANPKAVGPASDVWSLGAILYQMVSGRTPFNGDTFGLLTQILGHNPTVPSSLCPQVDAALDAICLKALAKNAKDRHRSMEQFARVLADYLARAELSEPRT